MPTLHLGVVDVPYTPPGPKKPGRKPRTASVVSTGDVAGFLENKYHPMEIFYEQHQQEVADGLAESMKNSLESLMMGAPASLNPFGQAEGVVEKGFHDFITNREMEGLGYPGVPTKAALDGVSSRFKRRKGPRRPSFVDTGLYLNSFKAWVD